MDIETFIARWTAREGGAERANYQMFLSELCDVLGVDRPEPAGAERALNDYVFERAVRRRSSDDLASSKRIDLYKKGSFILEAKQSRLPGGRNELPGQTALFGDEPETLGRRSVARGWDVMMQNARRQAEGYVFLLDAAHPAPPFIITCDVGHAFEVFADFTGTGRAYGQFPDRKGFRIYLEDLRKPEIRNLLVAIWTDPLSLDPARESARVTREIARRLAAVSKALEAKHPAEDVAHFLMRCIFTMFAEDVKLLPENSFTELLADCLDSPAAFSPLLESLWSKMDEPVYDKRFFSAFKQHLRHFNGNLFKNARAFPLGREEIGELYQAAKAKWTEVDPAIFGTLLEQALEPGERRKLGAHYTPRSYVQRLVEVTVMEPLRADWDKTLTKAEDAKETGKEAEAIKLVRAFHHQLCTTRVLDPACGTGNFLYVSLELMKKLEGEVLEVLARLGVSESLGLEGETVDPHQFLGLELNPRAAAIAELVVWIGYLQQWYKVRDGHPAEPILRAFNNINFGHREGYDAVLTWDGYPVPTVVEQDGKRIETYPNARRPDWPEAEFIVGNPPFVSNRDLRGLLSDGYVDQLKPLYSEFTQAADLVLFFWIRAAANSTVTRRIGFVSTSRIRLSQNNEVLKNALLDRWHIRFAIPDHDWPTENEGASVRVAFITVDRIKGPSLLVHAPDHDMISGRAVLGDYTEIWLKHIQTNLSSGPDLSDLKDQLANKGLCHAGVKPYSRGLHIDEKTRNMLFDYQEEKELYAPVILNGHDVGQSWRGMYVIDVNSFSQEELRHKLPKVYSFLLAQVKPDRERERNPRLRRDFWKFEANRTELRNAVAGNERYIATLENSPQRYFVFIPSTVLPDQKLRVVAEQDASMLALLSAQPHSVFSKAVGGRAGRANTPVYNTSCFTSFPFPDPSEGLRQKLRDVGEELDATRKRVLADHPDLTLTGLYNVLEKLKSGEALSDKDEDVKHRGLVLILKELHESIDRLTAQAYGWPVDLTDEQILENLVALNAERAKEEAAGQIRWLRPDYQIPRFAKGTATKTGKLDLGDTVVEIDTGKPAFPKDRYEQPLAVEALLAASGAAMDAATLSRAFKGGGKRIEPRIAQVLVTLARYGRATALPDGKYAARRAA